GVARRRRVTIPDDPTVLSHLLAGILQIAAPRRQALLEAATTEDRLRALIALIDRETFLLRRRLRFLRPDPHALRPPRPQGLNPISTPNVASGRPKRPTISRFCLPKQASPASAGTARNDGTSVGPLG